jgi:hypothetical protein
LTAKPSVAGATHDAGDGPTDGAARFRRFDANGDGSAERDRNEFEALYDARHPHRTRDPLLVSQPQFLTSLNLKNLIVVQVTVCCMAFAAILPLIVGEFDLSLGYSLGFVMMLGAFLGGTGFGAATILPVMLASGVYIGVVNGLLRITFNISSFIATLGVGILLSGVTQGMSADQCSIPAFRRS